MEINVLNNKFTNLRAIGKNELWLQQWITDNPTRLGLGNISIKSIEPQYYTNKGGRLDILAFRADIDTYYEIEVMLGECDSDHGFRVLDYWSRERLRNPNARHVAVIIAEDLSGRYKTVIETLPQFLPFIGIEIKTLLLAHETGLATTFATIVAQPDELLLTAGDEPDESRSNGSSPRDEEWWKANAGETFVQLARDIYRICNDSIGPSRLDFSAQSYISLKKGRRCWLPLWPRKDGTYIYLPGGAGGSSDEPSDFFARVTTKLLPLNIEPSWTYKYNGGANPIGMAIPSQHLSSSLLLDVLSEAYQLS